MVETLANRVESGEVVVLSVSSSGSLVVETPVEAREPRLGEDFQYPQADRWWLKRIAAGIDEAYAKPFSILKRIVGG